MNPRDSKDPGRPARVVVDMANLRMGGAVQVAASFLDELATLRADTGITERFPWIEHLQIEASTSVSKNLSPGTAASLTLQLRDRRWNERLAWGRQREQFEVSFVLFGPEYGRGRAGRRIIGFADGVTVLPSLPGRGLISAGARLRRLARRSVWRLTLGHAALIVVESDLLRVHLRQLLSHDPPEVEVVPNSFSGLFDTPKLWRSLEVPVSGRTPGSLLLAYVARAYPHKNHAFLAHLHDVLRDDHEVDVRFVVTLSASEWSNMGPDFHRAAINVGPIDISQAPRLYEACHAVIFPSLLESFSVTPLEAMRMAKPLFASDRNFVRDVCGDAPLYIDPTDPRTAAAVIAGAFADASSLSDHVRLGLDLVSSMPSARDRACRYIELIDSEVARQTRAMVRPEPDVPQVGASVATEKSMEEKRDQPAYGASEHYDADYFAWQNSSVNVKVRYKSVLFGQHITPTDVVADFGCAGGSLLDSLACERRIGIEINPAARAAAGERGVETFATLADVPNNVADVVISSHTLEHIPDPYTALQEVRTKIKPGGKLVLLLPIDDWRKGRVYRSDDVNHHLYTWTPLLLGNLLTEAGYSVQADDLVIVRHALMRHFDKFDAVLPRRAFDWLCKAWAYVRHSQEIVAVARPRL